MSDVDVLVKGLAAYDAGWRDCLISLRSVPPEHVSFVIAHLLKDATARLGAQRGDTA